MKPAMTRRERMLAIFGGRTPDRPAVKVWGISPDGDCVHPAYEPIRQLGVEKTELAVGSGSAFDIYCGACRDEVVETREEPSDFPGWVDRITVYHTPRSDLRDVFRRSTGKRPGYEKEYLLKEPEDIRRLLSLPYRPHPFSARSHHEAERRIGEAGIVLFGLDHPMYALQRLIGSENFALWSIEAEDFMIEAMELFADRVRDHAQAAIAHGVRGIFGWVGPELCIPPLMSPGHFERYVFALDHPLCDLIHDAGGRVWVHCHGKMRPVIRRFADMGVDVLNPIEPPPMGDVTMADAFGLVGDRMGLEGGIETHDFMAGTKEGLRARVHAVLEAGRGRRLILCPSSGYMEGVEPSPAEIENWRLYIEEGVRYAEQMRD
jgi:hypothetical protein